jgi:TolB-like protein
MRPDTNVFVVLPFAVRGPPSVEYLGQSMVDLLHMALDGVGRMRVEYAPTAIRRLSQLPDAQDARSAAGVALELGAGRLIGGTVVALGSDVRIHAEIFDAIRGRTQFAVDGRGDIANVTAMVDSLASAILARRLAPRSERRLLPTGEFATKSPAALQGYLVARQHWLRGERRPAVDSLRSALHHDPAFGRAHLLLLRIENAEGGITGLGGPAILKAALQHRDRYSDRIRLMLDIASASMEGQRSRALAAARYAADRYPDDPDAAYHLADNGWHFGINMGEPPQRVIAAFRRALAFDDQDPELLGHLSGLMYDVGDSAGARAAGERCRAVAASICQKENSPLFRAIFRREDPVIIASGADSLTFGGLSNTFVRFTPWDPARGLAITDSLARIQTQPSRVQGLRAQAYIVRSNVALARGQHEAAWAFLDSVVAADGRQAPGYRLLTHIVTGTHPERVAPPDRVNPTNVTLLMVLAWWTAVRASPDSAETVFRQLEKLAWPDSAMGVAVATGLRGIIALRLGDTVRARDLLTRARSNHKRRTIPNRVILPGAGLALKLAELEAARGDFAAARLHLADVFPQNDYVPFIGDAEELRAKVALALADTVAAKTALRNVIAVWEKAEPHLQPRVAAARATLARLEGH